MYFDSLNMFSDQQAITATADSTKKVHLGGLKIAGKMDPIFIDIRVNADFLTLTSLAAKLQQADTENGSYTDVPGGDSGAIGVANLKAGYKFGLRILPRAVTKPWLKLVYTVAGTNATAGKVTAALVREEQDSYEAGQYIDKGRVIA
jgi:hypothetical protein